MFIMSFFMWLGNLNAKINPWSCNHLKAQEIHTEKMQYKHDQKVLRKEEKEKYKMSLLPESGYMTREEYLNRSKEILNRDRKIDDYKEKIDKNMEYIPQPEYKLVRYNSPPGSADLKMSTKLKFDRKFICPGIVSPQKDFLVYPVVFYYAENQCSSAELYVIPLEKNLPEVRRVLRANIIKRNPNAIMSTEKDISEKFIMRTMTPIDFSKEADLLIAKEKIGHINDGVWQTNLWVYNFRTQKAYMLSEIRDAIKFYWRENKNLELDEKRWDIFPMGFKEGGNEIVVTAYGYTGATPKFLGTWSTDLTGDSVNLISIDEVNVKIQENGLKIVKSGVKDPAFVHNMAVAERKNSKIQKKLDKKALKHEKRLKKKAYKKKLHEMKKEERRVLRNMR